MARMNEVEIKKQSSMQVIVNKEDGYINGNLLEDQIVASLHRVFKLDHIKETTEHIKVLTESEEKYKCESSWGNVKGMYIHPFLALEMGAIKKNEDPDYRVMDGEGVVSDRKSEIRRIFSEIGEITRIW